METISKQDQTTLSRHEHGIDWGARRRVIAMTSDQNSLLFIREGHMMSMGARGFGQEYVPAALVVVTPETDWACGDCLATGRISGKTLLQCADKIDAAFGVEGLSKTLNTKTTTVIGI